MVEHPEQITQHCRLIKQEITTEASSNQMCLPCDHATRAHLDSNRDGAGKKMDREGERAKLNFKK